MINPYEQFPSPGDDINRKADELSVAEKELRESLEKNNFPAERKNPLGIGRGVLGKEDIRRMIKTIEKLEKKERGSRKTVPAPDGLEAIKKDPQIIRGISAATPEHIGKVLEKFRKLEEKKDSNGNKSTKAS